MKTSLYLSLAVATATALSTPQYMVAQTPLSREARRPTLESKPAPIDTHVVVSLSQRTLWVVSGSDTLLSASIAVASGGELSYAGRRWRFQTPRGTHVVRAKRENPVWMPPDWHYVEVAQENALRVSVLPPNGWTLRDGRRLVTRDSVVGVESPLDSTFEELPIDEHIVFDSTLFIPPLNSRNRRLSGELGSYALDLGGGYLLHGTRDPKSIGTASTHGCIRLSDADLLWLYEHIPVGARVYVR